MSLTILFQIPVDTGTANVSKERDNPNLKDFYLLTGKLTPVELRVATLRSAATILMIRPHPPSPSPPQAERSGAANLL